MPHKIKFTVVHCTGADDEHPAAELEVHGPLVRGWQSQRFCPFPQALVLQLAEHSRVRKIQILSHQHKIPSRVELHIGTGDVAHPQPAGSRFLRLGHVSFSSNEQSEYKARELKSVHIDATGHFIKLVIHKNHINKLNLYNQVGIVAINIIGDPAPVEVGGGQGFGNIRGGLHTKTTADVALANVLSAIGQAPSNVDPVLFGIINRNDHIPNTEDLTFDMYQDQEIAELIRNLGRQKDDCVASEKYDEAKRLKGVVDILHRAGEELGKLEVRKKQAVAAEDYDLAMRIKNNADDVRTKLYAHLGIGSNGRIMQKPLEHELRHMTSTVAHNYQSANALGSQLSFGSADLLPVHHVPRLPFDGQEEIPARTAPAAPLPEEAPLVRVTSRTQGDPNDDRPLNVKPGGVLVDADGDDGADVDGLITPMKAPPSSKPALNTPSPRGPARKDPNDDRPLPKKGAVAMKDAAVSPPASKRPRAESGMEDDDGASRAGAADAPEELTEKQLRELADIVEIFGRDIATLAHSKVWAHRESAFERVIEELRNPDETETMDRGAVYRAAIGLCVRGMGDKIAHVFLKGLELFGALTADPRATKGELTAAADKMLPLLILRTGDITPRTRDAALEAVVQAATRPVLKPVVVTNLIGNPKKPLATRIIRGKLEALEKLLEGGLDEDAGLSVAETMKSLRTMLGHASGEVRDAAVKAVLAMYRVCGPPIESHLKGIRPQLLEALNEGFDAIDGRAKRTKKVLPKKDPEKEKEETVRKLQEQLAELRQLAALAASGKSTVAAKKPNVDAIDEETEPDSTPSSSFKGKKLPAKAPVKASVGTKKSAGFPAAKPKGPVATVRSRSRTASVRSGASSRSSVYSDEDAEEDGRSSVASSVPPKRTAATKLTLQRTTSVTSGRSSVASMRGAKGPPIEKTCIFCAEHNESFTEDALDIHYWKSCPMLTQCMLCKQIVEVAVLRDHHLSECEYKGEMRQCRRCQEAVNRSEYEAHVKAKHCLVAQPLSVANRCPLCHNNIPPGDAGWKKHLMGADPCGESTRVRREAVAPKPRADAKKKTVPATRLPGPNSSAPSRQPPITKSKIPLPGNRGRSTTVVVK